MVLERLTNKLSRRKQRGGWNTEDRIRETEDRKQEAKGMPFAAICGELDPVFD